MSFVLCYSSSDLSCYCIFYFCCIVLYVLITILWVLLSVLFLLMYVYSFFFLLSASARTLPPGGNSTGINKCRIPIIHEGGMRKITINQLQHHRKNATAHADLPCNILFPHCKNKTQPYCLWFPLLHHKPCWVATYFTNHNSPSYYIIINTIIYH